MEKRIAENPHTIETNFHKYVTQCINNVKLNLYVSYIFATVIEWGR